MVEQSFLGCLSKLRINRRKANQVFEKLKIINRSITTNASKHREGDIEGAEKSDNAVEMQMYIPKLKILPSGWHSP